MKLLRWISLVTVLALLTTGLSLGALAEAANEEIYDITVGEEGRVVVRASGAWDAEGQLPAGVRAERGRLILENASFDGWIRCGDGPLMITVTGENAIGGIFAPGGLTLEGGGSLSIDTDEGSCIWADGAVVIRDVTLDLRCACPEEVAVLNIEHGLRMENVKGRIIREGGQGLAVRVVYDRVDLEGCDLVMQSAGELPALQANYDDQISTDLAMTVKDCRLEAVSDLWGICANGDLRIESSQILASSRCEETGPPALLVMANLFATDSTFNLDHSNNYGAGIASQRASLVNTTMNSVGYVDLRELSMVDSHINIQSDAEGCPLWVWGPEDVPIVNSSITIDNPGGDGVGVMGRLDVQGSKVDIEAIGGGLTVWGGATFIGSDVDIRAGEAAISGERYADINLTSTRFRATGKCGIYTQQGSVELVGGDIDIDASGVAVVAECSSDDPEDAIRLGSNIASDVPLNVSGEFQGDRTLYTLSEGEDVRFDQGEWRDDIKYRQFVMSSDDAAKRLHLYGDGSFDGRIDTSRRQLSLGMLANFTTTWSGGVDGAAVEIALPDQLSPAEGSVTLNGKRIEAGFEDGVLHLSSEQPEGTLRFSAYVVGEGDCEITGTATVEKDGQRTQVALPPCALELTGFAMDLPSRTSRRTLKVSGTAIPGGKITFFDNGVRAGEAQASLAGPFEGELSLNGVGSSHSITARVEGPDGSRIDAPAQALEYSIDCAEPEKLTITNTIHGADIEDLKESVFTVDFADPEASSPHYTFFPEYPTLSFELTFLNCNDPLGMGQVSLVTTAHDGTETMVPLAYDAERELWAGTWDYNEFTVPEKVRVEYTGGNYGRMSLMGAEIPYRHETDGSIRLGDGDDTLIVNVRKNGMTYTDPSGDGLSLTIGEDNHLMLDTMDGVRLMDIDLISRSALLSDGSATMRYDRYGSNTVITESETGCSLLMSDDGSRLELDDGTGNPMRYLTGEGLDAIEYPDSTTESWRTAEDGLSRTYTARDGSVLNYGYDDQQRLVSVTGEGISLTADYGEEVSTFTDENGEITRIAYDPEGRVSQIVYPGELTVSYAYDADGRVQAVTDPMGASVRYAYDGEGRLLSVSDDDGVVAEYTYDADGMISERRLANGARTEYADDAEASASSVVNMLPDGSVLSEQTTRFGEDGLVSSQTGSAGSWNFGYDPYGQLISVTGEGGAVTEYAYTVSGTLASRTVDGIRTDYVSNALNQVTAVGEATFEYDANGRVIRSTDARGEAEYAWDGFGRLVRHIAADGTVTEYAYDAFGNRSSVTVNGETTRYIWNPCITPEIIGAILPDGSYVRYIQGVGLEARVSDDGPAYYVYDALGSATALLDGDGQVLNRYAYDPEGRLIDSRESIDNPFRYVGRFGVMTDGDGLHYMRARYFSEDLGTFISPDPAGQTYDMNLYRYADNNRVQKVDISGLAGYWVIYYHWRKVTKRIFVPIEIYDREPILAPYYEDSVIRDANRQFAAIVRDNGDALLEHGPRLPTVPPDFMHRFYGWQEGYQNYLDEYGNRVDPMRRVFDRPGVVEYYDYVHNWDTLVGSLLPLIEQEAFLTVAAGTAGTASAAFIIPYILLAYAAVCYIPHIPNLLLALSIVGLECYNTAATNVNNALDTIGEELAIGLDNAVDRYLENSEDLIDEVRIQLDNMLERFGERAGDLLQELQINVDNMAEDYARAVAEVADRLGIDPEEMAREIDEPTQERLASLENALEEMADDFLDAVASAADAVYDQINAAEQSGSDSATEPDAGDNAALEDRLNEVSRQLNEAFSETVDEAAGKLPEAPQEKPGDQARANIAGSAPSGGSASQGDEMAPTVEYYDSPPLDHDIPVIRYEPGYDYVDGKWGYWKIEERWEMFPERHWVEMPDPVKPEEPEEPNYFEDEPEEPNYFEDEPEEPVGPIGPVGPEPGPIGPEPTLPDPEYVSPDHPTPPSMDPSGYVYEAAPGNRLEGVTATVYYKPQLETPDGEAVVWAAEDYDQVNPQQTDWNGQYGWMVPAGWYKVTFEKENYQTAESEWLPVPPVQTEVNAGLVSLLPPELTGATAGDAGFVEFAFDRYVKLEGLDESVALLRADGSAVPGDVLCLDAQRLDGAGNCGRHFRFNWWEEISFEEALTLRVDGAEGYNGLAAEAVELPVAWARLVGEIEVPEAAWVPAGKDIEIAIAVRDTWGDPMPNVTLMAFTPSSALALDAQTLVTGDDGAATLTVHCLKAGGGVVRLTDEQGRTSALVMVKADAVENVPEDYVRAMANGRAWLEDLKVTWTDGKKEDEAIAGRYADAFAAESDALRAKLEGADGAEENLEQLDEWDQSVRTLLFDSINRYISAEDLNTVSEMLYERGRIAYRLGA